MGNRRILVLVALFGCGDADVGESQPEAAVELAPTRAAELTESPADEVDPGEPPSRVITIAAVGDILFGRYSLDKRYNRVPRDEQPYADLAPILSAADVAFGNLESPVGSEPEELHVTRSRAGRLDSPWSLTFRTEPADVQVLADAGFDVLSLANNHARDMGREAVAYSREHVAAAGIAPLGVGATDAQAREPAVFEANGVRLAIMGWTVWLKGLEASTPEGAVALASNRDLSARLSAEIERVKRETRADVVAVSLHWGWEYQLEPQPSQRRAARRLIDAGASLVIGHHPHVVQTFERYNDGVIAYSLGNSLFDSGGLEKRRSVVLEVALDASGDRPVASSAVLHPVLIHPRTRSPMRARRGGYRAWRRDLAARAPGFDIAPEPAPTALEAAN